MASHQLDIHRTPLNAARIALTLAAAERIGLVERISRGEPVTRHTIRNVLAKWEQALCQFDQATMARLGVETIGGRRLSSADPDDLTDALLTALERIEARPAPVSTGWPQVGSFVA